MARRPDFGLNSPAKSGIAANRHRKPDIVTLAKASNKRRSLFFARVDKVQDPFRPHILARKSMVDHLGKPMSNRKTESMDPIVGYPGSPQNRRSVVICDNKVI